MNANSATEVLRQAGDAVDDLLRRFLLEHAGIDTAAKDFGMINTDLSLRIRQLKEELFNSGRLEYFLANDSSGTIVLNDFLLSEGISKLERQIHEKFQACLDKADKTYIRGCGKEGRGLVAILTGGGCDLPMVKSLKDVRYDGLEVQVSTSVPKWIQDNYVDLIAEYPKLAVSIGGSSPQLPKVGEKQFKVFGAAGERGAGPWEPEIFR